MEQPSPNNSLNQEKRVSRLSNVEDLAESELIRRYNYDEFTAEKVFPWLNFNSSPPVGRPAPSFPLWQLNGEETNLSDIWSSQTYTIVEFGSFT